MDDKNKSSFGKTVMRFVIAIPAFFRLLDHFLALVKYDAEVAKRNLILLLVLYLVIGSLLTSIWASLMGLLLVYFISLKLSWLMSLSAILILNLLLLVIAGLSLLVIKGNISFPETRQLLRDIHKNGF